MYEQIWGPEWVEIVKEVIAGELESSRFRTNRNAQNREFTMRDHIRTSIARHPGAKALINTGMFHAQKITLMGEDILRIGQLLRNEYSGTFSVAFIGLTGETKMSFNDATNTSFHLANSATGENVIRILFEQTNGRMGFLPMTNPVFSDEELLISFSNGNTIHTRVGRQFDALVTYPRISVLKSMNKYDIQ